MVGVPTLVHFLARSRPVRLRYPTVRFLLEAIKHRRALFRFRDLLVLLLRAAAVLLLAAAFARLFSRAHSAIELEGEEPTVRVVLLDASESMQARRSVVRVFDLAKATAVKYVKRRSGLEANVIVCGAQAHPVFEGVSGNLTELEAAVSAAEVRDEGLDVRAALVSAARMFKEAGDVRKELVIVSDMQASNWKDAPTDLVGEGVSWRFEQVGLTGEVGNLAVTGVRTASPGKAGEAVELVVEVGNFSGTVQTVEVKVEAGDATYSGRAECEAWGRGSVVAVIPAEGAEGAAGGGNGAGGAAWISGTVRLVDARDVLPADDARAFVVGIAPVGRHVILSRESGSEVATSRYFLQEALSAGEGEAVRVLDGAAPDADILAGADLVAVAGAGRLPAGTVKLLAALVTRGTSLLVVAEGARDLENLLAFEKACGEEFRFPVAFSPYGRWGAGGRRIDKVKKDEQPFAVMAGSMELLRGIEFAGALRSVAGSAESAEDVLATYNDGSAALVVTPCGRGRVGVLNADIARSTLPSSPLFVPLVQELAERLTKADGGEVSSTPVGKAVNMFLPPSTETAGETRIEGPVGGECGKLEDTETGVLWTWREVERRGVYRVLQHGRVVQAVAAVCPAEESDLRTLAAGGVETQVAGAKAVDVRHSTTEAEKDEERTEWWPWLMLGAFGCLVGELAILKLFRS